MKLFTIDFQTHNRDLDRKPISKRYIQYQEEYFNFVVPLFKKAVDIIFHRMWLEIVDLPGSIIVEDPAKLIVLNHANDITTEFKKFKIGNERFNFDILFDPRQVKDYLDFDKDTALVKFCLKSQLNRKDPVKSEGLGFELKFFKAFPEPEFELNLEPEFITGFEHRRNKRVRLGELCLSSNARVRYSVPLDCDVTIGLTKSYHKEIVYFGRQSEIVESDPVIRRDAGIREKDDMIESITAVKANPNQQNLGFSNILPKNVINIPIYIDLDRIKNPLEATTYSVSLAIEFKAGEQKIFKSEEKPFIILPDKRTTALWVQVEEAGEIRRCDDGDILDIKSRFRWNGPDARGRLNCFDLKLGNYAESGTGAVEISNLTITFEPAKKTSCLLVPQNGANMDSGNIFLVNNQPAAVIVKSYQFPNAPNSFATFTISFRHDKIMEMTGDIAKIQCLISFDYREQVTNDVNELKKFSCAVIFEIEKNPGSYWLAIDFGTSAIVAAFDEEASDVTKLVNLQTPLKTLVTERAGVNYYTREQIPEYDTNFLASTVIMRNYGVLSAKVNRNDMVFLAPTKAELRGDIHLLVPYLKALIGTEYLPNFNNTFDGLTYYRTEQDKINKENAIKFKDKPLEFRQVLSNAYRLLLRDFILKNIEQKTEVNKIIISIPNTFSPRHVDHLKSLIATDFKEFKNDYILFISESDAVACHYVAKRFSIRQNIDELKQLQYQTGTEYVLIYDMGAGTLDLTYLKIESDAEGNKYVTIIGRLGKGTAGNYFDYMIAKAIYDLNEVHFQRTILGTPDEISTLYFRSDLKDFIKEEVKPRLNDDNLEIRMNKAKFDLKNDLVLKIGQIKNSKYVQEFLKQNTRDIFKNFFTLYKSFDGRHHNKGEFPLNTVVLSGRSIQFKALQQAIRDELKDWITGADISFIDFDEKTLKSAVVQGALQYALVYRDPLSSRVKITNRNLQARYGVLYKDTITDRWNFKELLNPATRPINEDKPHFRAGMTVFEYDTDRYDADPTNDFRPNFIDLTNTAVGYFVQSFSADTARDKNNNNMEYITTMFKFSRNDIGYQNYRQVPVRIRINADNEMIISVGNFDDDPTNPLKIDLDNSDTFKNSMWPYWE